jgi:hypothetical protein
VNRLLAGSPMVNTTGDRLSTSQFDEEFAPVIEHIEQATGHCLSKEEEEIA